MLQQFFLILKIISFITNKLYVSIAMMKLVVDIIALSEDKLIS